MIRKIITWPDKLLSRQSLDVEDFKSVDFQRLLMDMKDTLAYSGGVGLSAIQIGDPVNVFILDKAAFETIKVELPPWFDQETMVFANPKVLSTSKKTDESWEGCLSFPDIFLKFDRPKKVTLTFQDVAGVSWQKDAEDFLARALLHEYEHTQGTVFLKYVGKLKREMVEKKLKKRKSQ